MRKKIIVVINDRDAVKGGADAVALMQVNELRQGGNDVTLYSTSPSVINQKFKSETVILNEYDLVAKNFIKNIFWFRAYQYLRNVIKLRNPDFFIVHGWTKQLSSSIFYALLNKQPFLVAHDYFLICPNGGLFDYQKKSKCHLKGGGLRCLLTQCDKENYLHKLFRWGRFWIQKFGIALSRPRIVALNQIQASLIGEDNIEGILKNRIDEPVQQAINFDNITQRKFITYIGRGDPEKGVDIFSHPELTSPFPLMLIGPSKGVIRSKNFEIIELGWLDAHEINMQLEKSLVGIFPSVWYEVDPLVPWKFIANGVPVIASIENVFGLFLRKHIPELVYENVYELNKILERICDKDFYNEVRARSIELHKSENELRTSAWERGWHEFIN